MTTVLVLDSDEVQQASTAATGPAELRQRLVGGCVPDLVVLDVRRGEAVEVTASVHAAMPETRMLVVADDGDGEVALACLRAGAAGAISESEAGGGLFDALQRLRRREAVLGAAAGDAVLDTLRTPVRHPDRLPLTPMQERILSLMATGATNRSIATRLGLAEKTVKNYATGIFTALGAANRTQAVALWTRRGALD